MALRGRAATPVRPGLVIKQVLIGKQPLIDSKGNTTGELVNEACATDLHSTYKSLINAENQLRPRLKWLKGSTSFSFAKYIKFAKLMGLIEVVREEPMVYPPPHGNLIRAELDKGKLKSKIATRKVLRITALGISEEHAWLDLRSAWQLHAPLGVSTEPIEEVITPIQPIKKQRKAAWLPITLSESPSTTQFKKLRNQLIKLQSVGIGGNDILMELERLSRSIGDWDADIVGRLETTKDKKQLSELNLWQKILSTTYEAIDEGKIQDAIDSLEEIAG